jgi:hypothetical protein
VLRFLFFPAKKFRPVRRFYANLITSEPSFPRRRESGRQSTSEHLSKRPIGSFRQKLRAEMNFISSEFALKSLKIFRKATENGLIWPESASPKKI